jgi:hypothetical protein
MIHVDQSTPFNQLTVLTSYHHMTLKYTGLQMTGSRSFGLQIAAGIQQFCGAVFTELKTLKKQGQA